MTEPSADNGAERLNVADLLVSPRNRGVRLLPSLLAGSIRLVRRAAGREFAVIAALQVVAAVALAGQVLAARSLLARVIQVPVGDDVDAVWPALIVMVVLSAIVAFTNLARSEQQRLLTEMVARHAVDQVLQVATSVDLLTYEDPAFHNRLVRAYVNAASRPAQMASGVLNTLSAVVTIAGIGAALVIIEPVFLAVVALAYAPLWVATSKASSVGYFFTVAQTERDRRRDYLALLLTRREEAAEIRAFGLGPVFRSRFQQLYAERIAELTALVRRRLRIGLVGGLATQTLNGLAVALVVWFVSTGRLDLAQAGAAAASVVLLAQRLAMLGNGAASLFESSLFIQDFTTFVDIMPVIEARRATQSPPDPFRRITVENVTFSYPTRPAPALADVSLEIERGEVIALVGENGSGKTTLAKVIAGLYEPTAGAVKWDGVDIATCDPALVRDQVGVVLQDYVRYMLSARENITLGRHERGDDPAWMAAAAAKAGADGIVAGLPDGYETQLGAQFTGGSDLSGGQWQRVATARAFFRDAPLLILDEPTASLDARSEADLFDRIRDLYAGRTVVLISHRFATVRSADRIHVLDHGRIIEQGSHDELMERRGRYAELFTLQAAGYLDVPPSA